MDDIKLSDRLLENIVKASGKSYNQDSKYDVKVKGPEVYVSESTSDGVLIDRILASELRDTESDWASTRLSIIKMKQSNSNKRFIINSILAITLITTCISVVLSFYMLY